MAPPGSNYHAEKIWAIAIVVVLAAVVGGILVPLVARVRAKTLARRLGREGDPEEQRRLQARLAAAKLRAEQSPFSLLLGKDQRLSTSKTIAWLWTLVVAFVLIALVLAWPDDWTKALGNLAPNYLLLLGGPYAAFVFAKASVATKLENGKLQKPPGDGTPRLSDLVGDDAGRTDLTDAQYVIFNLIAMAFVIDAFWRATTGGFPEIPGGLLLLTGGPAAIYAANKALASNAPVIASVFPSTVRPGDDFTVYGENFMPAGAAPAGVAVDGVRAAVRADAATPTEIVATAPIVDSAGPKTVTVLTSARQAAVKNLALDVRAPLLTGLDSATAAPGALITATGEWAKSCPPSSVVDGVVAGAVSQPTPGRTAIFTVPRLAAGRGPTVDVALALGGLRSETHSLTVE